MHSISAGEIDKRHIYSDADSINREVFLFAKMKKKDKRMASSYGGARSFWLLFFIRSTRSYFVCVKKTK